MVHLINGILLLSDKKEETIDSKEHDRISNHAEQKKPDRKENILMITLI